MPWYQLTLSEQALHKRADLCLECEFDAVLCELEANRCLAMYRDQKSESVFYVGCDDACQLLQGLIIFYNGKPCSKPDVPNLVEVSGHFSDPLIHQIL